MQFIPTLLPFPKFIDEPGDLVGWLGWGLLFFFILWLTNRWKDRVFERIPNRGRLFTFLILSIPVVTLFLGAQANGGLTSGSGSPTGSEFFPLAALPWVLTSGMIGIFPSMILAGITGLVQAVFLTHSLFTPLSLVLVALVFGYLTRQNFRTRFFTLLRHPLATAVFSVILFFPVFIFVSFLSTRGQLAIRLDESFTQSWTLFLAFTSELLIAGMIAEFIFHRRRDIWFEPDDLVTSPVEKSLKLQFLIATVPFLIAILVSLSISIWWMAKNVSLQIIREDLLNTAENIGEGFPGLISQGETAIKELASPDLMNLSPEDFISAAEANQKFTGFFSEGLLLDDQLVALAEYPGMEDADFDLTAEESAIASNELHGSKALIVASPRDDGDIQVTFFRLIESGEGTPLGILIARTQFALNTDKEILFASLNTFERGIGNVILFNGGANSLAEIQPQYQMDHYVTWAQEGTGFFEWVNSSGVQSLNYFQPIADSDWSLILNVPNTSIAQRTFSVAFPLLFITALLIGGAIGGMLYSLNRVSGSLRTLSFESTRIAKGDFSANSSTKGEDEVGKLGQSFEDMRSSLRSRLEELDRLVRVSKGVASSLDIEKSLQGVLQAAMDTRGSSARIVLTPGVTLKAYPDGFFIMKVGTLTDMYAYFDKALFDFMKHQELLALPKPSRMRRLDIPEDRPTPSALIARAIHHDDQYFGVLWVGYEQSREFTEEEIQYINMLGDQASLAASNAALFCSTEIARQRFEAVLASAPEPILVFDEKDRLLMLNPAARDLQEVVADTSRGNSLEETLTERELIQLIRKQEGFSALQQEITLRSRKVFVVDISPVYAQGSMIGKICTLREITAFKKLESQKTEFVETVSHDLRSPLSRLKGYATMLPMLGEMNDQQQDYLKKINTGIDGMSHLVNNLLDLGRIEASEGIRLETVNPALIIERVVKSLLPEANHKAIILEMVNPDLPDLRIRADSALLQQAVLNLVENAIHFTNVGGRVDAGFTSEANKTTFFVKDTGIGISPIDLPGILNFQPSSLVERARANSEGTSVKLGLKIAKTIAEKHRGSIRVESQLGKGSTFFLEIPSQPDDGKPETG